MRFNYKTAIIILIIFVAVVCALNFKTLQESTSELIDKANTATDVKKNEKENEENEQIDKTIGDKISEETKLDFMDRFLEVK